MLPFLHRLRGLRRSAGGARQYLAMGAHGKLYFNIGSPQNFTTPTYLAAVTRRVDPNTDVPENSAQCVRNSVGMAFHLKPRQPCITKHARDWTSDDMPSDDVDVVSRQGGHFGFPYWWPGDFPDPQYGKNRSCTDFTKLKRNLGAHVASALAHRQDVPGQPYQQHLRCPERLAEPHRQARL